MNAPRHSCGARAGLVIETKHPNTRKYPNQKILIVNIGQYAYLVPCVVDHEDYFMKTIIPSRKATKKYLGESDE